MSKWLFPLTFVVALIPNAGFCEDFIELKPRTSLIAERHIAQMNFSEVEGQDFNESVTVNVLEPTKDTWAGRLKILNDLSFSRGETVRLTFWARGTREDGKPALIRAIFQKDQPPFEKSLELEMELTDEWQEYSETFVIKNELLAGQSSSGFHVTFGPQTLEFGGIKLEKDPQ